MTFRKYLSVLCTVVLLVVMSAIAAPVATVNAATTYTQGFEPTLGYHYGSNIGLSSEQAYEGTYSAKTTITKYSSSTVNNRVTLCDANGPVLFTVGTTYTVTMQVYAVTEFSAKVRVISDPTVGTYNTSTFKNSAYETVQILQAGVWNEVTVNVTATAKDSGQTQTYLSAAVVTADDNNQFTGYPYVVYVDNIAVKVKDATEDMLLHTFERANTPAYVYGDAAVSQDKKHSGSASLKITIDNAATSKSTDRVVLEDAYGNPLASKAGYKYILSAWYYTEDEFVGKVRFLRDTDPANLPSIDAGTGATGYEHVGHDLTNADQNNYTNLATGVWTQVTKTIESQAGNDAYWSLGVAAASQPTSPLTIYLDDVQVIEIPPSEAVTYESVLNGKTALFSGDSIAAGWRDTAYNKANMANGGGWSLRLEKQYLMTTNKAALAGNSFTELEGRSRIVQQLHNNSTGDYDYVILEGGFNDCMGANKNPVVDTVPALGSISTSYDVADFDTTTFAGAFEELLYYATTYYPEAAIGFIVTYQTPLSTYGGITDGVTESNEGYTQADYFNLQMAICEKWNVPYLNLWSGKAADGKTYSGEIIDVNTDGVHFPGGSDNIHLNTAGYDVITPYIATWMEGLSPYTAPTPEVNEMNAIASVYQYVGGGVDNTTLKAQENYAVYTHADGTLRTAFRIAATYKTDSADFSTIVLEDGSYKIKERGIILGTAGQTLTTDSTLKSSVSSGFKDQYWKYDSATGTVTYTALVKNVSRSMLSTAYVARSYMVIERNGVAETIYSDTSASFTPQYLYNEAAAKVVAAGGTAPVWFMNSNVDDGVVDLG